MGYIIFALIAMGVLLGFSYVVVYGCLFIVWLISLFFDRDERRKQREETERSTEMFHQMTEELKDQNEAMRQQIERKKIENQQKREEIARQQNKDQ
ncbi:hypothetical protein AKUA1404_01870 [Apilactobacillus kunkeei]|uniref:Uncharacterized protein n=1 Tax=Apilactobacillus nanyangensis TaxID=2799579 RepID=A0ABT0HXF1_9LACO|nr:hypothetical protein [Apilactobacillus nanyangensis]MCK8611601.1 hypothetical protein [Apilactobacillus nanyangensis]CAI2621657.1 hypothetical protein AKUA1404_01870 [Apilactobacillus kunkeei]